MAIDSAKQIEKFKDFVEVSYKKKLYELTKKGESHLLIDFSDLLQYDHELADELLEEPEETIKAAEIAISFLELPNDVLKRIRFRNLPESQKVFIKNIRSSHINNFFIVEGIVRQSSDVRPQVTLAKFECPSCGNSISIPQLDTKFKEPSRCSCGRRGKFRLLSKDLVDVQRLIIEESPESLEGGEQPKRMAVFVKEDLVEPKMEKKTTPGTKIRVYGVIKEVPLISKTGGQSTRYDLMIDCNYIEPIEESFDEIDINEEDQTKIIELSRDPLLYDKLINSVAPSIYGHLDIKEAMILQLFGGVRKIKDDGTKTRGDLHMLLVGDPGTGKSQILQFITKIAPKARFISGKGATSAGITASIVKDEFLRGWALEAGAMVLANKGIAIIDELDKMGSEDRSALHEAMEQQQITINKANIQATLRAETTVLAAANPRLGRFDPYQPIAAQIDLPPTLINRFDLIFPIRDMPNRDIDDKIATHVLAMHKSPTSIGSPIEPKLLKKYLSYSKQRVFPKLSNPAIEEIKSFYVGLRNSGQADEGIKAIPISARQLEALVRLAEASARARLSDIVTKEDSQRAIRLLKHCLMQVGFDYETGRIDIDRIYTGITASTRSKIAVIREIITDIEGKGNKTISIDEIVGEATKRGIDTSSVEEVVDRMKKEGLIFEPKRGFIQKI
ncbi:minichromosome maintenance protein MCM [Candidatus Woesearchaeota archaeon]|nr:minichromosome maintenance protein MCM [Candidatus Woesearchaeota archaeon]